MKFRYKAAIFIVAAIVSFIGFNLIASPLVCVTKIGNEAKHEIINNYLAKADSDSMHLCSIPSK